MQAQLVKDNREHEFEKWKQGEVHVKITVTFKWTGTNVPVGISMTVVQDMHL